MEIEKFIETWQPSSGSEMANFQSFANDLTDLIGVERPRNSNVDGDFLDYRFERPVLFTHTGRKSRGRIDLYKRGCFVLEAKQGGERISKERHDQLALGLREEQAKFSHAHGVRGSAKWDDTMLKARNQADGYARAVSKEDGWPPFLLVVDVGHVIEVYADFSGAGQGYNQFPDGNRYRISLEDLRDPKTRDLLRTIWTAPESLDTSLKSAAVTRDIAVHLAELGKSFEGQGHDSETVARFLMRCLFSMFAEDVELIPGGSFTTLLKKLRGHPEHAAPTLKGLWETMNSGGFSAALLQDLRRFNGGLFKESNALPLDRLQLGLLIEAAEADWKEVEPAIFGTLLERALDERQRHKLGAHYTPRSYVERLVTPTIMEPLRTDWKDVQTAVQRLMADGKEKQARTVVRDFHRKLCEVRVLDPACGSGNFLYVAMEMMKRLEGEVIALLQELGEEQAFLGLAGHTVDPHQFLGIEVNPWAAAVAELVLWIGYLQWHFRTHGKAAPSEPVLRDFRNIENRDAVLEWEDRVPRVDDAGNPVTRWDGVTTTRHPVTGEEVPAPNARIQVYDYSRPKPASWPEATFIVGNPPFVGASRLRDSLGDGYVEALWKVYPKMPQSADLVMFWWDKAAFAARAYDPNKGKGARRFGLITTSSLRQTFNRRVVERHLSDTKKPLSLQFAIPDHPWVDTQYGAAVRIAMTVGVCGNRAGELVTVAREVRENSEADGRQVTFVFQAGSILSDLRIGADVASAKALIANFDLAHRGMTLSGDGFLISEDQTSEFVTAYGDSIRAHVKPFKNGSDFTQKWRGLFALDFFGLTETELRNKFPAAYQHLLDTVYPVRQQNNRQSYRDRWWVYSEPRSGLRDAVRTLGRFFATTRTGSHKAFQATDFNTIPESEIVCVAHDGYYIEAILNSKIHQKWAYATGGRMGAGNHPRYNHANCFNKFPFPDLTDPQKATLDALGEELDCHRKRQQATYLRLTLTQMYNVLEKLRAGETIEGRDKEIYDQGLIGILRDIHDRIDTAVAEAYGWPVELTNEEILFRLVDLNKERAAEEAAGHIRWLRPEYQNPEGRMAEAADKQAELDVGAAIKVEKAPWPKALPDQITAVREALEELGEATPDQIARRFQRARTASVDPLLASLAALGQAQIAENGHYVA